MSRKTLSMLLAFLIASSLLFQSHAASTVSFKDVPASHWASDTIAWAAKHGIINGFPDGSFRPGDPVTEPQFLSMLLRAYPDVKVTEVSGQPWYKLYYDIAESYNWPVWRETDATQYDRGRVAQTLAATQGKLLSRAESIQLLLDSGLSSGKTSATVAGFAMNDKLTRAEAVRFIKNMKDAGAQLSSASGNAKSVMRDGFLVRGIAIGDSEASVISKYGQPLRKDASEYGFEWYIFHDQYKNYMQVGVKNGKVVGLYTNSADWQSAKGITLGSPAGELKKKYGEPLDGITKGRTVYRQSKDLLTNARLFLLDGAYVTFFLDAHEQYKVTSVQIIEKNTELSLRDFYGGPGEALRQSYEQQVFDLASATRVRFGLKMLQWDDKAAASALKHSKDMADNNFFEHNNLRGQTPFDRMEAEGIDFRQAAENIAAGQTSAIFAHEAWMNSTIGHRETILNDKLTRLGVGVHMGGNLHVYYTQNFYAPW